MLYVIDALSQGIRPSTKMNTKDTKDRNQSFRTPISSSFNNNSPTKIMQQRETIVHDTRFTCVSEPSTLLCPNTLPTQCFNSVSPSPVLCFRGFPHVPSIIPFGSHAPKPHLCVVEPYTFSPILFLVAIFSAAIKTLEPFSRQSNRRV